MSDQPKTIIGRSVGETGHVEMRLAEATEWDEDALKETICQAHRKFFREEPTDYGVAVLPFIETDHGQVQP